MTRSTVLVVEDDRRYQQLIRLNLDQCGYRVLLATDGLSGLNQLESEAVDLVVLDIMLPGMNGYDVCRRIRDSSRVPIIMVTARAEPANKIQGFRLGADDYVTKPFRPDELLARIEAVLRRSKTAPVVVSPPLASGDLGVDFGQHRLTKLGKDVSVAFLCLLYGLGRLGRALWQEREKAPRANAELVISHEELLLSNEEIRERNYQLLEAYENTSRGTSQSPISLIIADPDANVRRILARFFGETGDLRVTAEVADESGAVAATERMRPDVVLIDATLARSECITELRSTSKPLQIIVLGTYPGGDLAAIESGASDYVLKDAGRNQLLEVVRRAASELSNVGLERIPRQGGAS